MGGGRERARRSRGSNARDYLLRQAHLTGLVCHPHGSGGAEESNSCMTLLNYVIDTLTGEELNRLGDYPGRKEEKRPVEPQKSYTADSSRGCVDVQGNQVRNLFQKKTVGSWGKQT